MAELAGAQHGVVSGEQLRGLGYSRDAVSRAVQTGRLHRLHQGVYAVGHTSITKEGLCLAAGLACGDGALLSHRSAAWLWGLTRKWSPLVEVTARGPRQSRDGIRLRSAEALIDDDRARTDGIPVTAVPRTLLDFAAIDPWFLGRALDQAERLGLLDLIAIDALIARSRGFRGVARLRTALHIFRLPGFTRSGLERHFLALVRSGELPPPSTNCFVAGYELDAFWPKERFAVELDTFDYHGTHRSFESDRLRQEELKLAGIEMVRITGARLDHEPSTVIANLERLLHQRRQELRPFQPG